MQTERSPCGGLSNLSQCFAQAANADAFYFLRQPSRPSRHLDTIEALPGNFGFGPAGVGGSGPPRELCGMQHRFAAERVANNWPVLESLLLHRLTTRTSTPARRVSQPTTRWLG